MCSKVKSKYSDFSEEDTNSISCLMPWKAE